MSSTSSCSFSTLRHSLSNRPGPFTAVCDTYHNAAQALGLLHNDSEGLLCFNEAILDSNSDILMADLAEQECIPTEMTWNACLRDISNRLETMGRTMTDFGLPEPADDSTEVARECMRTCP